MPPLALTSGDPAGIGPEITLAAWSVRKTCHLPAFAIIADPDVLRARANAIGIKAEITPVADWCDVDAVFSHALPVIAQPCAATVVAGTPNAASGASIIRSIDTAVTAVIAGDARAVVTNPIAKHVLYETGFRHAGHTEYLHELSNKATPGKTATRPVMMLVGDDLRVAPVTIHMPLRQVFDELTTDLIMETVTIIASELSRRFAIPSPRLVVSGLNPHAGENGTLGTEDRDVIAPAIDALQKRGLQVVGPLPADTMFHARARQQYDAAIMMYHDQALIPIKALAFDTGVNVTLGLSYVRTSPDHGTAFNLAGTGTASPESLIAAIKLADELASVPPRNGATIKPGDGGPDAPALS